MPVPLRVRGVAYASAVPDPRALEVPDGWVRRWQALREQSAARLVRLLFFGDSLTVGYPLTADWRVGSYPGLVGAALRPVWGDGGTGWVGITAATNGGGVRTLGTPWLLSSGWSSGGTGGLGQTFQTVTANATAELISVRGRRLRVWFLGGTGGGTHEIRVNGTLMGTVNTVNPSATVITGSFVIPGSVPDGYTVLVTHKTGGCVLAGAEAVNDHGVVVDQVAVGGVTSTFSTATIYAGAPASETIAKWACEAFAPDLFVWALGVNDVAVATTADTFQANCRYAMTQALTARPEALLLGLVQHVGSLDTPAAIYDRYAARLRNVALALGGGVYDAWARGRSSYDWLNGQGYMADALVHLNSAGHAWLADPIADLVTNEGLRT